MSADAADKEREVVTGDATPVPAAAASKTVAKEPLAEDDPLRWVRRAGFLGVLVVGWVFIGWQNRFYFSAPVIIVGLGYLAVLSTIYALWRTGVVAVAEEIDDDGADSTWGRPTGRRGELEREKRTLLKAIKEAEFDREMGKLSPKDAEEMIAVYRLRAIEAIKEIDQLEAGANDSVRQQIEREVKARLELDAKATKAKAEAKADAARDKKRKDKAAAKSTKPGPRTPDVATTADAKADLADPGGDAKVDGDSTADDAKADGDSPVAKSVPASSNGDATLADAGRDDDPDDADSHEPPSQHDSTMAANEPNAKAAP